MSEEPRPPVDMTWLDDARRESGWVRRAEEPLRHVCDPPSMTGASVDDLWRCLGACRRLWRVGLACGACDARRRSWPHGGQCVIGFDWRPARFWQRLRYRWSHPD